MAPEHSSVEQNNNKKTKTHTHTHTPHQLVSTLFYFFFLVNAAFCVFLFKLAQNQVKSQKVCHCQHGLRRHRAVHHVNFTSTETLAGSGRSPQRSARWSCCGKPPTASNIHRNGLKNTDFFVPTKQHRDGTDAAFRLCLEK